MKRISTYIVIGLEIVGFWLISQHRYMNFRTDVFICMCIIGIAYIICEFIHIMWFNGCITDLLSNDIDNENDFKFTLNEWEEIKKIKKEIEDRINE